MRRNFKKYVTIARAVGLTCFAIGLTVLLGWHNNIGLLLNINPEWVTMKPSTAFGFQLSGIIFMCIEPTLSHTSKKCEFCVMLCSCILLSNMWLIGMQGLFRVSLGLEDLIFKESVDQAILSVAPGIPSVGTILLFIIVSSIGICAFFNTENFYKRSFKLSIVLVILSVIALVGYVFDVKTLYFYIPKFSTAMAVHTAFCFMILGISSFRISMKRYFVHDYSQQYKHKEKFNNKMDMVSLV